MLLFVFLVIEKQAFSQSIGATAFYGNVIRHREFLAFEQPNFTQGYEIEYVVKKDTSVAWQKFWRYPDITYHLHIHNFGNPTELGSAYSLYPTVNFVIWKKNRIKTNCQMGAGMSYLSKKYEANNIANNAIGSHWNSILALRFEFEYKATNNLVLTLGPQLFHYSAGAAIAPNAGLNVASVSFGLSYLLGENTERQKGSRYKSNVDFEKWNFEINTGLGFRQINIPNGLTYKVPQISLFAHYNLFEYFRIVGGLSYQYNYADYYFLRTQFESKEVSSREARDFLMKFSGDFLFGNLFARFQFGFYLPFEEKVSKDPFSTMFSLNYARKIIPTSDVKLFFGVGVRSHKFVAQYVSINAGFIL